MNLAIIAVKEDLIPKLGLKMKPNNFLWKPSETKNKPDKKYKSLSSSLITQFVSPSFPPSVSQSQKGFVCIETVLPDNLFGLISWVDYANIQIGHCKEFLKLTFQGLAFAFAPNKDQNSKKRNRNIPL